MFENNHWKSHENKNSPKNEPKVYISQSKSKVGPKSRCHMKVKFRTFMPKSLFILDVEKFPKTA